MSQDNKENSKIRGPNSTLDIQPHFTDRDNGNIEDRKDAEQQENPEQKTNSTNSPSQKL